MSTQAQGNLELHIPKQFGPDRPALRFSHVSCETNLKDHPRFSRVPRPGPGSGPWAWEGGSNNIHELLKPTFPPGAPLAIDKYLNTDEPPIWLHVLSFHDATIIALQQPHAHADGMSVSTLVQNWCRVLAGDEEKVSPLSEYNPMNNIEDVAIGKEEWVLKNQMLTPLRFFLFALVTIFHIAFGQQTRQQRALILPGKSVAALRQRAEEDLDVFLRAGRKQEVEAEKPSRPFISDGDIVSAFLLKGFGPDLGTRTLSFMNVLDPRKRLPQLFDPAVAYVSMTVLSLYTTITANEARDLPLGRLALRIRDDLVRQSTPPQICAQGRQQRATLRSKGKGVLAMRDVRDLLFFCTNWSQARFFEVADFGPAVLGRKRQGKGARGKPDLFFGYTYITPTTRHMAGLSVYGKDRSGNYWLEASLPPTTWNRIDKDLANVTEETRESK